MKYPHKLFLVGLVAFALLRIFNASMNQRSAHAVDMTRDFNTDMTTAHVLAFKDGVSDVTPYELLLTKLESQCEESQYYLAGMAVALKKQYDASSVPTTTLQALAALAGSVDELNRPAPAKCFDAYMNHVQIFKE